MHPLNFVRDDYIVINTPWRTRRVSKRRYKVSDKYTGTLTHYVGKVVRLVDLDDNREIGQHVDDILAVTLDSDVSITGGMSYPCAVGIPMMYLEPVTR